MVENSGKLEVRAEVLRWVARTQPNWLINENPAHGWFASLAPNLRMQNFQIGLPGGGPQASRCTQQRVLAPDERVFGLCL